MNTELATVPPVSNPFALLTPEMLKELDVEKLERVFAMQERMDEKNAERLFNTALAAFQSEMPPVFKWRQESKGKYNYAAYDDIMKLARPILRKCGLSISCDQSDTTEAITVILTISHTAGHSRVCRYTTPKDGPIKTADGRNVTSHAQAQSSSNSYARRICLCNALDIVVTDEDDDGAAAATQTISQDQAAEIYNLLEQIDDKETTKRFLAWIKVESVDQIPADAYAPAVKNLRAKIK